MAKKKPAARRGSEKPASETNAKKAAKEMSTEDQVEKANVEEDDTKGRPPGSENRQYDQVDAAVTRCRKCGGTDRTPYEQTRELEQAGTRDDGPYTHIVWRRTQCKACGQWRVDRFFENRSNAELA